MLQSLGLGAAAGIAGCSGSGTPTDSPTETDQSFTDEETPTPTPPPKADIKMGGELVATFGADVKNSDPTQANDTTSSKAISLIFETLMATNFSGTPKPQLATSVEQQDELNFRINLREGVTFHNGDDLTADDVKFSFERYEGTPRESDVYDWYASSTVVDDTTIDVELAEKYAPFKFALGGVPIVPQAAGEGGSVDLTEKPVGTGPYTFVKHEPDSLWRIKRNEDHWFEGNDFLTDKPPIKTVTFRVITEQSAQVAALEGGDVDMINNVLAGSVSDLRKKDKFEVPDRVAGGFDMFIYPSHPEADTPFQNRKVRQGVNRLIPREDIVKSVYNGIGIPAYAPISPLAGAFTSQEFQKEMGDKYARYNREKATQLLEEGFQEAGYSKPFETNIITNQNPQRVKWSQLIQQSLNSTDFFDVGLNQFEWNTYLGKILAEDSHTKNNLVSLGWSAGFDPDAYVNNLFNGNKFTPACCNINHYQNDKVDELIQEGLKTYDLEERQTVYEELQREIVKESPMAFIRFGKAMDGVNIERVKNWSVYPIDSGEYNGIYAPFANKVAWVDK